MNLKKHLKQTLAEAAKKAGFNPQVVVISHSKNEKHGDLSSNMAMSLTKTAKKPPLEIAEAVIKNIENNDIIESVFSTPPGFINFKISDSYYQSLINEILHLNINYGKTRNGKGKSANVEFVSANPTGPLTVGHGRNAVLGDTVSNILEFHGYEVTREYYFNDAGRQMRVLAESVAARYNDLVGNKSEFPEDGYQGEYIKNIAERAEQLHGKNLKKGDGVFRNLAEDLIFEDIKESLKSLGIQHNIFSNEKNFYESGSVNMVISDLKEKGLIFEKDKATWFKTTQLGMKQDRVLIKSSGEPTYRLPDMAYHIDKINRNFDLIIDVLGADHVDTYPDVVAALEALGHNTDHFKLLIHQFVTLLKGGKKVKMSTRKADFVTLEELVNDFGKDVVRYFFIMRGMNSHLNFDLDLAADQSEKNPVYYLQYAHARICNIIKHGTDLGVEIDTEHDPSLIQHPAELKLIKIASHFPDVMETALKTLEPQGIANYLHELASCFHKFYGECKVISDDNALTASRIALINSIQIILEQGLHILGVSAPEKM